MANTYDIGDGVRISCTFTVESVSTDPTTVTLKVKDPSLNEDTYTYADTEITKSDTGDFYKDIEVDEAGIWYYRWEGTGAVIAATENYFQVRASEF